MRETKKIWVCADCMIGENSGDYSGMSDERAAEVEAAFTTLANDNVWFTLGHTHDDCEHDDDDGRVECETQEFSWSSCDVCDSRLGGERHAMTLWFKSLPGD